MDAGNSLLAVIPARGGSKGLPGKNIRRFAHKNRGIRFKTLVLGPVATNIFGSAKLASKVQETVRDLITVSVDQAVGSIVRFIHSDRQAFFYPKHSCLLYYAVRIATSIFPRLYKGSAPSSPGVSG